MWLAHGCRRSGGDIRASACVTPFAVVSDATFSAERRRAAFADAVCQTDAEHAVRSRPQQERSARAERGVVTLRRLCCFRRTR